MFLGLRVFRSVEGILDVINSGCQVDVGVIQLEYLCFLSGSRHLYGCKLISHFVEIIGEFFTLVSQLSTFMVRK